MNYEMIYSDQVEGQLTAIVRNKKKRDFSNHILMKQKGISKIRVSCFRTILLTLLQNVLHNTHFRCWKYTQTGLKFQ